jgi:acyl-CoA synthetase (AMP-forming)/AMP-acid ligase II/acyl carrier protein
MLMISPRLLYHLISDESSQRPQDPAILSPGKDPLTYLELSRFIHKTALQLTRLGFRSDDRLAVALPNGPEMATAFLAVSSVCTCAPLNPTLQTEEFKFSMEDMRVKALVALPGSETPVHKAAVSLGIPVICLEPDGRTAGVFNLTSSLPFDETISEPILANVDDIALILHTSGTTSRPKIVPLPHANVVRLARIITDAYALVQSDRCLNMMPLFHIHGLIGALAAPLISGGSVVCTPGCIPDRVMGWLRDLSPTWYTAVPAIHHVVLEQARHQPEVAGQAHLRFIRSSSSPLPPQVGQELERIFDAPVLEAYGMTESTHQIASNPLPPRVHKFGSAGIMTGTTRVAILDEQGAELAPHKTGEICLRGENVITAYENNPAANAANFINGWLRTGDLGYLDDEGYLFIQGRKKEIINRGGEKISPREIDETLMHHPAVKQAVAFAVPHPSLGEDIGAAIVLQNGQSVSVQELRQFAAANLADFKVPRQIVFVKEIPKGATGKIQRIGLAEKLKAELEDFMHLEASGATASRDKLEAEILSIWQEILEKQQIGIHDDFLAMGGESLQAARILAKVNERFSTNLQIIDIFNAPTVALMAVRVRERNDQAGEQ